MVAWKVEFKRELECAIQARERGNEGMARVHARRAAGIVVGEYLNRQGYKKANYSTYNQLSIFTNLPDVDERYKQVGRHFLTKVNHEHNLPVDIDLIRDASWLKEALLNGNEG